MNIGSRFGRWVVLEIIAGKGKRGDPDRTRRMVLCRCDCGTVQKNTTSHLLGGQSKSCGCSLVTHGATVGGRPSPLYRAWSAMIDRCENPNGTAWHRYGGRGISVCLRWRHSFINFRHDMGPTFQPGLTLDRIDNDRGYDLYNCRWATRFEQAQNTVTKLRAKDRLGPSSTRSHRGRE